jgi:CubicO group peptidase (beta-lactamase class C family)
MTYWLTCRWFIIPSVATDVLARLVEVISGQRFDAFIQSRILGPLGMVVGSPFRVTASHCRIPCPATRAPSGVGLEG